MLHMASDFHKSFKENGCWGHTIYPRGRSDVRLEKRENLYNLYYITIVKLGCVSHVGEIRKAHYIFDENWSEEANWEIET
jgi:hypothetical protein